MLKDELNPDALPELDDIIKLSAEDIRAMVLLDRRPKEFYNMVLRNTQEAAAIAQLIGHLCWKNYETSRRFGKIILKGLNNVNVVELKPYVEVMIAYLSLQDEYQEQRIEWLFGVPDFILVRAQNQHYSNDPRFDL